MDTIGRFREWFWRPPRAHGDVVRNRVVSPVEPLYDLVYVVVISQAAHVLAVDVSPVRMIEFAVVFGMIWIGWVNGSLYLDLHGREDGRTRSFVFIQMGILALLAVFTGGAAEDDGPAFAFVYVAFLAVLTWLWIAVRGQDSPEFMRVTEGYAYGFLGSIAVVLVSAFAPADLRLALWAIYSAGWIVGTVALGWFTRELERGQPRVTRPSSASAYSRSSSWARWFSALSRGCLSPSATR
jgi:low temperature requirement protein LtrA